MTKNDLEAYVEDHFGMDLHEFIKHKVEVESLYDYEIADLLNEKVADIGRSRGVLAQDIGWLRNEFGIKRANGFSRRFEHKYGQGAVDLFKDMIEDPINSLSDVARRFGFSRQYAWQTYKKIYGFPYTEAKKRKRRERRKMRVVFRKD